MNRSGTPSHNRPPLNSSASNSSADNNNSNDNAYRAALRGASLAFQNTGSKAQSSVPPARSIDNGALLAATSTAHHYGLSPPRSPPRTRSSTVSRQTTGSSVRSSAGTTSGYEVDHGAVAQGQSVLRQGHAAAQFLAPPGKQTIPDAKSPSFIAATLAASRSGSPSPRQPANPHPYQQPGRRQQGGAYSAATSVASLDLAGDTAPLPSTNALISMFEKKDDADPLMDPVKKQVVSNSSSKPPITKAKPKPKPRPVTPPRGVDVAKQPNVSPATLTSPPVRETPASGSVRQPTSERPGMQKGPTGPDSKRSPPAPPPPRSTTNQVEESPSERAVLPKRKPRASTPPRSIASADTSILSPQPRRASSQKILSHRSSDDDDAVASRPRAPPAVKPKPQHRASTVQHVGKSPAPLEESPRPIVLVDEKRRPSSSSSNDTFVSAESEPTPQRALPRRPGNAPSTPDPPRVTRPASTQSVPTTATATATIRPQSRRILAPPPPLPQRQQQQKQQQSTGIPLDALTNAIVAGSLATSRLTPSMSSSNNSRKPPSPPPSRRQTPLRLRQTLREPPSSGKGKSKSDDDDSEATRRHKHRHRKKPFGQKGKHAHHEGQRKRWREEITPRERKRYEGVWASNRGYLLVDGKRAGDRAGGVQQRTAAPNQSQGQGQSLSLSLSRSQTQSQTTRPVRDAPPQRAISTEVSNSSGGDLVITRSYDGDGSNGDGDLVANVVVRDLWARSRLPADELAEVWDLVDGRGRGALDRAEFVVGTWLVDQRLRGRKIPRKVSDSVWSSARSGGAGVRIRVKGVRGK